jgi:hypothetical protein
MRARMWSPDSETVALRPPRGRRSPVPLAAEPARGLPGCVIVIVLGLLCAGSVVGMRGAALAGQRAARFEAASGAEAHERRDENDARRLAVVRRVRAGATAPAGLEAESGAEAHENDARHQAVVRRVRGGMSAPARSGRHGRR